MIDLLFTLTVLCFFPSVEFFDFKIKGFVIVLIELFEKIKKQKGLSDGRQR